MREDRSGQNIPSDCMTDWYYDRNGRRMGPIDGDRCRYQNGAGLRKHNCKSTRDVDEPASPPAPLHQRVARTLVMDTMVRSGTGAKRLCEHPSSVGPSYAHRHERLFCRMTDKTLWPFCEPSQGKTFNCFDEETEVLVEENVPVAKREIHWDLIEDWHHTGQKVQRALSDNGEFA